MIKAVNVARINAQFQPDLNKKVVEVVESGRYVSSHYVESFEQAFAEYLGVPYFVALSNGLDALRAALVAVDVGYGDGVILPANSYTATAMAVHSIGAMPILVDVNEDTFCMNTDRLGPAAYRGGASAVIPVHLTGNLADMKEIVDIANGANLSIVEDCAQAHGAVSYGYGHAGSFGDAGAFSFFPSKNLGALGDAGGVSTKDLEIAETMRAWRNQGQEQRYVHSRQGVNARMDSIHAVALELKLAKLDDMNMYRRQFATYYEDTLAGVGDIKLPSTTPNAHHVFHLFVIRTEKRDELREFLKERDIETLVHYPTPIHLQEAFAYLGHSEGDFPVSEHLAKTSLSLPVDPTMTLDEVQTVVGAIVDFYDR